jgi:hypothetical protein
MNGINFEKIMCIVCHRVEVSIEKKTPVQVSMCQKEKWISMDSGVPKYS